MNSPDERREAAMLEATRSWHEIALHRKPAIAEERRHFFDAGAAYDAALGEPKHFEWPERYELGEHQKTTCGLELADCKHTSYRREVTCVACLQGIADAALGAEAEGDPTYSLTMHDLLDLVNEFSEAGILHEGIEAWLEHRKTDPSGATPFERPETGEREDFIERLRLPLEYLADRENWLGNPHDQEATLHGHFTPYELAVRALDASETP